MHRLTLLALLAATAVDLSAQAPAYGFTTFPCRFSGNGERVSGRIGRGSQGVIDMGRLGRSAFNWSTSGVNDLAIELPKTWQGDAKLYRARMTRDGKRAIPAEETGPPPSAVAMYREFNTDEKAALQRYAGRTLVLEGRRGTLIEMSGGGAAVHVPDGFTTRALVLVFGDLRDVSSIAEGSLFRFTCTVESFDYRYVHLQDCLSCVEGQGTWARGHLAPGHLRTPCTWAPGHLRTPCTRAPGHLRTPCTCAPCAPFSVWYSR